LEPIKRNGYMLGIVTKDEYAEVLRACQAARDDMRIDERDKEMAAILGSEMDSIATEHDPRYFL